MFVSKWETEQRNIFNKIKLFEKLFDMPINGVLCFLEFVRKRILFDEIENCHTRLSVLLLYVIANLILGEFFSLVYNNGLERKV
jgi:hypothetical protein